MSGFAPAPTKYIPTGFDPDFAARMQEHDEALTEARFYLATVQEFLSTDSYLNQNTGNLAIKAASVLKGLAEAIESNREVYG